MAEYIRFEDWEREQMKDPEFRAAVQALEPAYQIAHLRMQQGLTQKQLARRVGTRQSSISRLESGKSEPSLSFLRRTVEALGAELVIQIREAPVAVPCSQPEIQADPSAAADIVEIDLLPSNRTTPAFNWNTGSLST